MRLDQPTDAKKVQDARRIKPPIPLPFAYHLPFPSHLPFSLPVSSPPAPPSSIARPHLSYSLVASKLHLLSLLAAFPNAAPPILLFTAPYAFSIQSFRAEQVIPTFQEGYPAAVVAHSEYGFSAVPAY